MKDPDILEEISRLKFVTHLNLAVFLFIGIALAHSSTPPDPHECQTPEPCSAPALGERVFQLEARIDLVHETTTDQWEVMRKRIEALEGIRTPVPHYPTKVNLVYCDRGAAHYAEIETVNVTCGQ